MARTFVKQSLFIFVLSLLMVMPARAEQPEWLAGFNREQQIQYLKECQGDNAFRQMGLDIIYHEDHSHVPSVQDFDAVNASYAELKVLASDNSEMGGECPRAGEDYRWCASCYIQLKGQIPLSDLSPLIDLLQSTFVFEGKRCKNTHAFLVTDSGAEVELITSKTNVPVKTSEPDAKPRINSGLNR